MVAIISPCGASFRDAKGNVGKCSWHITFDNAAAANYQQVSGLNTKLINIMLGQGNVSTINPQVPVAGGLTNGALIGTRGVTEYGDTLDPSADGLAAAYLNAEDKMVLTFLAIDHTLHRISIPSPVVARFLSDQETVNDADATVALLAGQFTHAPVLTAFVSTRTGIPFLSLVGGVLVRRKRQRKLTIWTKDPTLSIPEE